jgi:hypothetical protein
MCAIYILQMIKLQLRGERELEDKYEKWGLKINYVKTEYLRTDHSGELQIDGNAVPTVQLFEYLGSIVQGSGPSDLVI